MVQGLRFEVWVWGCGLGVGVQDVGAAIGWESEGCTSVRRRPRQRVAACSTDGRACASGVVVALRSLVIARVETASTSEMSRARVPRLHTYTHTYIYLSIYLSLYV